MALLVLACAAAEREDTAGCLQVIEVSTSYMVDGDVATTSGCVESDPAGGGDYEGCCPEGWYFVAVGEGGATAICCLSAET